MIIAMFSLLASLILAGNFEIGPMVDLPAELDICTLQAEICMLELEMGVCGAPVSSTEANVCVGLYEDCSYDFEEAHESSCRQSYVWCKLESTIGQDDEFLKFCVGVYEACPTADL